MARECRKILVAQGRVEQLSLSPWPGPPDNMIDTRIIQKTGSTGDVFAIKDRQPMSQNDTTILPAVVWKEVSKVYENGYTALNKVSLQVRQGEILALLGTSGSGKTTLLKMVNRLIEPSSGEVLVRDQLTTAW